MGSDVSRTTSEIPVDEVLDRVDWLLEEGEPDKARNYYHQALEAAGKMRFRSEIALTRLQLCELMLDHYPNDRAEALEHLDFAIGEFRDMKMQPSLERALSHRDILKA